MTDDTKSQASSYAAMLRCGTGPTPSFSRRPPTPSDAKDELIKRQSAEIGRLVAVTLHCGAQEAEVERLSQAR